MKIETKIKIISIIYVLLFTEIFINHHLLIKSQKQSVKIINLSGKQRMLTQKMSKEAYDVFTGVDNQYSLQETATLFDVTLNGLLSGDNLSNLPKASGSGIRLQLEAINEIWIPFYRNIEILQSSPDRVERTRAFSFIMENNINLLNEMDEAVLMIETAALSNIQLLNTLQIVLFGIAFIIGSTTFVWLKTNILKKVSRLVEQTKRVSNGDLNIELEEQSKDEIGELVGSINTLVKWLRENKRTQDHEKWMKDGALGVNNVLQGDLSVEELSMNLIQFLSKYIQAHSGLFYSYDVNEYVLNGWYAAPIDIINERIISAEEGAVGQVTKNKKYMIIENIPSDYLLVRAGVSEVKLTQILLYPIILNNEVLGVMEFGSITGFEDKHIELLNRVSENIATSLNMAFSHYLFKELSGVQGTEHQIVRAIAGARV